MGFHRLMLTALWQVLVAKRGYLFVAVLLKALETTIVVALIRSPFGRAIGLARIPMWVWATGISLAVAVLMGWIVHEAWLMAKKGERRGGQPAA